MKFQENIFSENGQILYLPQDPEVGGLIKTVIPDVYVADTEQQYALLSRFDAGGGRKFRYSQNDNSGNILVPGRMVQQNWENGQMTGLVPATASIGDKTVTLTIGTGAIVENQFQNGWLFVEGPAASSAEKGFIYQIESHPAASGSATCVFTLKRALVYGISATRRVSVYPSPVGNRKNSSYGCKVVPAAGQTFVALGIPACRVPQANFFWAQYKGLASLETDGSTAMVKGQRVSIGGASDGCGMVSGGNTDQIFGVCIHAGGFSRSGLIALDLPEI